MTTAPRPDRNAAVLSLLAAARLAGDARRVKAAEADLVALNTGLVKRVVLRRLGPRHPSFDDMVQEGLLALLRAVRSFDPARGVRFSTWAGVNVAHHLKSLLARPRPFTESELGESLADLAVLPLRAREVGDEEDAPDLSPALDAMTPDQRRAVELRFGIGTEAVGGDEAARLMGKGSRGNVYQLVNNGLSAAKRALGASPVPNSRRRAA